MTSPNENLAMLCAHGVREWITDDDFRALKSRIEAALDGKDAAIKEIAGSIASLFGKKDADIARLRAALTLIADICEGSTTPNSLPNIAKIAREALAGAAS